MTVLEGEKQKKQEENVQRLWQMSLTRPYVVADDILADKT